MLCSVDGCCFDYEQGAVTEIYLVSTLQIGEQFCVCADCCEKAAYGDDLPST